MENTTAAAKNLPTKQNKTINQKKIPQPTIQLSGNGNHV